MIFCIFEDNNMEFNLLLMDCLIFYLLNLCVCEGGGGRGGVERLRERFTIGIQSRVFTWFFCLFYL